MATMEKVRTWRDRTVIDSLGDRIGKIEDVYYDEQTAQPEWALVNTGMLGDRHNFVPLPKVRTVGEDVIQVPYTEEQIRNAPAISAREELSMDQERQLYEYYGIDWAQTESSTLLPRIGAAPAWGGRERIRVSRPTGLVRLRAGGADEGRSR